MAKKKKHKKPKNQNTMPTNIEDVSTKDLIDHLIQGTEYEPADIGQELKDRIIPDTYEVEELRGGVRPTVSPI